MTLTFNYNTLWQFSFTDPAYLAGDTYQLYILGENEYTCTPGTTVTVQFFSTLPKSSYIYTVMKTRTTDNTILQRGTINVI